MKRKLKIVVSLLLVFAMMLPTTVSAFAVSVDSDNSIVQTVKQKMLSVFYDNENLQLDTVKTAYDFAGNLFYIAECVPTGYFIYNPNTDTVVESSEKGYSPYIGLNENLFYGGPTYYYVFANGEYKHALLDAEILSDNQIAYLQKNCEVGYKNIENEYLNRNSTITTMSGDPTDKMIAHPDFYKNLTHCGYINGGYCGFIALGMLIAYKDKYEDNGLMDDKYWENSNTKTTLKSEYTSGITVSANNVISKKLYDLYPKSSTTSMHIHDVAKKYLAEVKKSANHTSRWKPLFTESTIRDLIDEDNPVILFGILPKKPTTANLQGDAVVLSDGDTTDHAVVAYGYTGTGNKFIVHYGWENSFYPDAKIDLGYFSLGSIYSFDLN